MGRSDFIILFMSYFFLFIYFLITFLFFIPLTCIRYTQKGSLTYFFRNSVFIQFQNNYLFLTTCENMVAVPLL